MAIKEFRGEYRFLSNFYPAPIEYRGIRVATTEHAFQLGKLPDDATREEIEAIAYAGSPGEAKRAGRKARLRTDWETVKIQVMREVLLLKFSIPELRNKLLATGDEELIEGNTWGDRIWGIDLRTGVGENNLGRLLMEVRAANG